MVVGSYRSWIAHHYLLLRFSTQQACKLVISTESIFDDGIYTADKQKEAVQRVKQAQSLVAKFLAESGVKDENIDTFIAAHP